jgi:hypothetical protein
MLWGLVTFTGCLSQEQILKDAFYQNVGPFEPDLSSRIFPDPLQGLHKSLPVPWQASHSTVLSPITIIFLLVIGKGAASFLIFPIPLQIGQRRYPLPPHTPQISTCAMILPSICLGTKLLCSFDYIPI